MNIKVIPNELVIVDTKNEFIKLKNKSNIILDVSGWFLKAGGAIFEAPDGSLIAANSELMISSDISKLKFAGNNFSAEILYPNGSVAFSYLPAGQAGSPLFVSSSSSKPKEIILSKPPEKRWRLRAGRLFPRKILQAQAQIQTQAKISRRKTTPPSRRGKSCQRDNHRREK